jgi:hypothetical protein
VVSSLNLAENNLGKLVLPEGWQRTGRKVWTHSCGAKVTENPGKPVGVIAIANALPDMGALSVLSLKANRLLTAEAGQILSDMLATNSVLKELDVSDNNWDDGVKYLGDGPGFARALSVGIKDNGALTDLKISANDIGVCDQLPPGWSYGSGIKEYKSPSGSWQKEPPSGVKPSGLIAISEAIKNNGAMTSLNLSSNKLGAEGAKIVAEAIKVTMCAPAIIMALWHHFDVHLTSQSTAVVCYYLQDMGALSLLNLTDNCIALGGGWRAA